MNLLPDAYADGPAATPIERDVVVAEGPDTVTFLQGQLSQDVAALDIGSSAWSLLLQPQGKVDAWLRVTRAADDRVLLDVDAGAGAAMLTRLERFKLRTNTTMTLETWSCLAVRGPGATDAVASIPADSLAGVEAIAAAEWPGIDGVDVLGPTQSVSADTLTAAGIASATPAELEIVRIVAGVPAMGAELTESTIPAEAGIVDRSASFTKGCYTGQELVARIDSRGGNVPRKLHGIVLDAMVELGAEVTVGEQAAGVITSVAATADGAVALAYIKRAVEAPADGVVGGIAASIRTLPLS